MNTDSRPQFTILIPTYNRSDLISRSFKSIEAQTLHDFDVLIIDDGSTDNTQEVVDSWSKKVDFSVYYRYQDNQGKPAAYNSGILLAKGFFIVLLDSDDLLTPNALEIFARLWATIPEEQHHLYAGVECLSEFLQNHEIVGTPFPHDGMDSNFLETRFIYNVHGEPRNAIRTEVAREFPFPVHSGEKDMPEHVIWSRMAHKYQFRYGNDIVQLLELQPDGLTANVFQRRIRSPNNFRLFFQEMVNDHSSYLSSRQRYNFMAKYIRFSFHARAGIYKQFSDINDKALWLLALPRGFTGWLLESIKAAVTVKE